MSVEEYTKLLVIVQLSEFALGSRLCCGMYRDTTSNSMGRTAGIKAMRWDRMSKDILL